MHRSWRFHRGLPELSASPGRGRARSMSVWCWGSRFPRLVRSCRDSHQLLEMCALLDKLIGDVAGIYAPASAAPSSSLAASDPGSRGRLYPPILPSSVRPVARTRAINLVAADELIAKRAVAFELPLSTTRTIRARKSDDKGSAMPKPQFRHG